MRSSEIIAFVVVIYLSTSLSLAGNRTHSGCSISLPRDIPESEPLYLKKFRGSFSLFKPANETNIIRVNSNITLSCLGRRNRFVRSQSNVTNLVCRSGNRFESVENGTIVNFKDLNCTKTVQAELKITSQKCSYQRGRVYEIGFKVYSHNFLKVFKVCYDNVTETTFFAEHVINGAAIKYSVKENKRKGFQTSGLGTDNNISRVYNKRNQIRHFTDILGASQPYFNNSMFLARGHLTPDADFIFPSFQLSTYFYVNTAPEFQVINAGNWVRIENMVRELAGEYRADFLIYTGVYEVLQLPNESGQLISLYLDNNNKVAVPKWFWKVIKNTKLDAAIVVITLNNPFAARSEINEFCPSVCEKASLNSKHFQNIRKGYTFCCEVDKFKEVVQDLPSNLTAKSLLSCSHANYVFKDEEE